MAEKARFQPEESQVVSDLGQMRLFASPMKMRILRILQQQEATISQLSGMIDEPEDVLMRHIRALSERRLIRTVDRQVRDGRIQEVYRATAYIYNLRPAPTDIDTPATTFSGSTIAAATMDSLTSEIVTSIETWPNQRMNYEGRRARIPYARAEEFHEKLVGLVDEYWGSAEHPAADNPDDPLLAFIGFWYRFPEET